MESPLFTIHNSDAGDLRSFEGSIGPEEKSRHVEDKGGVLLFTSETTRSPEGVLPSQATHCCTQQCPSGINIRTNSSRLILLLVIRVDGYKTNTNDIEEKIAWDSVIKRSFLGRAVPAVPNTNGFFDFKDAGEVATEIAHRPVAQDSIAFRHHSSGVRVPFSQLAQRIETLRGGRFEVVSLSDWIQKAQKLDIEDWH